MELNFESSDIRTLSGLVFRLARYSADLLAYDLISGGARSVS